MMFELTGGKAVFSFGRNDEEKACLAAEKCAFFRADCEDETESDERSCYNCAYRRWTAESFQCVKGGVTDEKE